MQPANEGFAYLQVTYIGLDDNLLTGTLPDEWSKLPQVHLCLAEKNDVVQFMVLINTMQALHMTLSSKSSCLSLPSVWSIGRLGPHAYVHCKAPQKLGVSVIIQLFIQRWGCVSETSTYSQLCGCD